jgi:hypothetical protein
MNVPVAKLELPEGLGWTWVLADGGACVTEPHVLPPACGGFAVAALQLERGRVRFPWSVLIALAGCVVGGTAGIAVALGMMGVVG